jgi:hypothetical protein
MPRIRNTGAKGKNATNNVEKKWKLQTERPKETDQMPWSSDSHSCFIFRSPKFKSWPEK